MAYTYEQLAQLRTCDHGNHQIDEMGIGKAGEHLTTCPDHATFSARFASIPRTIRIEDLPREQAALFFAPCVTDAAIAAINPS